MNMFKRLFGIMFCFVIVFSLPRAVFAQTPVQVIVGGEEVVTNVRPIIIQGRVMLPARAAFETLDAIVDFACAQNKIFYTIPKVCRHKTNISGLNTHL